MGVFEVNAGKLITAVAGEFKKNNFKQPVFVEFVKTGMHRERAPQQKDWYYVRMASVLYRLYKEGPLGTGSLRTYYGGRKNRGTQRHHFYRAGGKIIRACLQELEKNLLVKKAEKGRVITPKGQKLLNEKAKMIASTAVQATERKLLKEEKRLHTEAERKVKEELRKIGQPGKEEKQEKQEKRAKKEKQGEE